MGMVLENGYEMKTTFYEDFTIADAFGSSAVNETYKNAYLSWKHDHIYMTELSMVLNWKVFEFYNKDDMLYDTYRYLYETLDAWCMNNLEGEELAYYIKTTD